MHEPLEPDVSLSAEGADPFQCKKNPDQFWKSVASKGDSCVLEKSNCQFCLPEGKEGGSSTTQASQSLLYLMEEMHWILFKSITQHMKDK